MAAGRLIIGLGNPGRSYQNTRHNIGFEILDSWVTKENLQWKNCRYAHGQVAELPSPAESRLLFKPQTYMNASGEAVRDIVRWGKWKSEDLVVVLDDIALPLGKIRLRTKGSAGGHNGLKSIEASLSTQNYPRIRIGVGQPTQEKDLADYVLDRFLPDEQKELEKIKENAIKVLKACYEHGLEEAMARGNKSL